MNEAVERVVKSGTYLLGPELERLEAELARVSGRGHAVGVGSGTDALVISLKAMGIGPGDEVIVPALTAIPTAAAVALAGAIPVLADVDPSTACLTVESVDAAYTPRTAAVILVHLYGFPAPAESIAQWAAGRNLALVEDMAQAFGAEHREGTMVGGYGIAGCASFYPTKVLAAAGDAGAVLTDDSQLAEKARLLRSHGHEGEYRHSVVSGNSRLDEIQAAILMVKLPHLAGWVSRRREIASSFRRRLQLAVPDLIRFQEESPGHAYQVLAARIANRDSVRSSLAEAGLNLLVHYPLCLAEQDALAGYGLSAGDYPEAVNWSREQLSLPTAAQVTDGEVASASELIAEHLLRAT